LFACFTYLLCVGGWLGHAHEGWESDKEQRIDRPRHDGKDDNADGRISALRTSEPGLCHDPRLLCRTQETRHHSAQGNTLLLDMFLTSSVGGLCGCCRKKKIYQL